MVSKSHPVKIQLARKGSDRRFFRHTVVSQEKLYRDPSFEKASPKANVLIWKACRFRMQNCCVNDKETERNE